VCYYVIMKQNYKHINLYNDEDETNYELFDLIESLAKQENVGITSDREIFQAISDEHDNLVAASWISWDGENYEWDVVVDNKHQGNGIGKELINSCIDNFDEYEEINEEATMEISVTSEIMVQALKNRGFKISLKISDGFYKMEQTNNIEDFLLNKSEKIDINSETIFYHGNENKIHRFSEIKPSFFTTDPEYAKAYGDHVYQYKIHTNKIFNTAENEEYRNYYNNIFLNDELGQGASKIEKGQHIHFNDADNFWSFISVEVQIGNVKDFDSIIVDEKTENHYSTNISIVPFDKKQIKPINKLKNQLKP
jgi:ribosomal protein S18 acetylase RimI-like enzyme